MLVGAHVLHCYVMMLATDDVLSTTVQNRDARMQGIKSQRGHHLSHFSCHLVFYTSYNLVKAMFRAYTVTVNHS